MIDNSYLQYVLDLLMPFCRPEVRKMFGAFALYHRGKTFAFVIDNELYFKAPDKAAQEFFAKNGAIKFSYEKNGKTVSMCYWKVPLDVLEDQGLLENWFKIAVG